MAVYAKSVEAKDDLRSFVWDFGQEYNQVKRNFSPFFGAKIQINIWILAPKINVTISRSILGKKIQFCHVGKHLFEFWPQK